MPVERISVFPFLQNQIVAFMLLERARQDKLKAEGRFRYVLSDFDCPNDVRLACLLEELAEVGKALMGDAIQDAGDLEKELMQLGALTIAWLEYVVSNK